MQGILKLKEPISNGYNEFHFMTVDEVRLEADTLHIQSGLSVTIVQVNNIERLVFK